MFQTIIIICFILFSVLGLLGNTIIIYKFLQMKKTKLHFYRLMILLAFYDNSLIIMVLLMFVIPEVNDTFKPGIFNYIALKAFPFARIAITGSIYSKIAITIERYLTVCHPLYAVAHRWSARGGLP